MPREGYMSGSWKKQNCVFCTPLTFSVILLAEKEGDLFSFYHLLADAGASPGELGKHAWLGPKSAFLTNPQVGPLLVAPGTPLSETHSSTLYFSHVSQIITFNKSNNSIFGTPNPSWFIPLRHSPFLNIPQLNYPHLGILQYFNSGFDHCKFKETIESM